MLPAYPASRSKRFFGCSAVSLSTAFSFGKKQSSSVFKTAGFSISSLLAEAEEFVGTRKALAMAVKNRDTGLRQTALKELVKGGNSKI
jgi:hypothetical protein